MDSNWVEQLTIRYRSELLSYLRRHIGSMDDAEDLCQEVFLSCYKHSDSFDPSRCDEHAWLYIIARNRLKNYYRDKKTFDNIDDMDYELTDGLNITEQTVLLTELREELAKVLKKMDERSRSIIIMRFFENKSHKEIAEILNMKEGSVRMAQQRALQKMRQEM